ncbi:hypothetical protein NDGK_00791 [Clostridiales bacterium CHKCI001]|nr:hypothetical protein NDGK_00791 [Clostridiales bacterium CHKCI001]
MVCGEKRKENLYREDLKALIEYKREENGDRLKDIVKGVCQINGFYKLGRGQYIDDKIVVDRILKRVGLDPGEVEMIILKKDAQRFIQREKIYEAYNQKQYEDAEQLIQQYEKAIINEHVIHRQFIGKMRVLIIMQRSGNINLEISMLKEIISYTIPEFESKPLKQLCLAPEEMELLTLLASCYRRKNQLEQAKRILKQILDYTKGRKISSNLTAMYMPYVYLELSKIYERKEQYEDARYYAITGINMLYCNARLFHLVELQDQYIKLEQQAQKRRTLSYGRKKRLEQMQIERTTIIELYQECNLNPYMLYSMERYRNCYVFNELLERYRKFWRISKREFCEDVCTSQSFQKIELEGSCPVKTFFKWMKKLKLPQSYYITQLHGGNVNHIRKKARIDQYIRRNQYKKAEILFKQLENEFKEKKLIDYCPENKQYFLTMKVIFEKELYQLLLEKHKRKLEQALLYTVPEYPNKRLEDRLLLRQEVKVLNNLAIGYAKQEKYKKALSIWEKVIQSYQNNYLYGYTEYDAYNLILVNYVSIVGNSQDYEKSTEKAYESIKHFFQQGTIERVVRCCYYIVWNREQEMLGEKGLIQKESACQRKLCQAAAIAKMLNNSFYIDFLKEYEDMFLEKIKGK